MAAISVLLARIDPDVVRAVVLLAIVILGGLARLLGNRPPVRPAAPPPPGKPVPPDVADEIDDFLRRATQRRNAAPGGPQLQPQPPSVRPVAAEVQPAAVSAPSSAPIQAELVDARPVGREVADHVKQYLDSDKFESRAEDLGQDVVQTVNREIDQHLQQVFDHSVGRLAVEAEAVPAVEAAAAAAAAEPPEAIIPASAPDLAALLSSADLVRQAIVFNELLRRPEERWR
jgi:hypothetical protein